MMALVDGESEVDHRPDGSFISANQAGLVARSDAESILDGLGDRRLGTGALRVALEAGLATDGEVIILAPSQMDAMNRLGIAADALGIEPIDLT